MNQHALRPLALAAVLPLAFTLAACGSGDDAATEDTSTSQKAPDDGGGGVPRDGIPGASGEIAAVDGGTLQVQNEQNGQVAVIVTDTTEVADQVAGSLSDVEVGACVVVGTEVEATDAGVTDTAITAETVAIRAAGDDGCSTGFGGGPGGGGPPADAPSDLPEGAPDDRPEGDIAEGVMPDGEAPEGGMPRAGGRGAVGEVTAVNGGVLTVTPTRDDAESEATVEVDGDTTYTVEVAAESDALTVGRCVTATGETDDVGAVTADRVRVSDPVDGECAFARGTRPEGAW